MSSHMYKENRKTLNWFVGCNHHCIYCIPSFQRQMKRQRKNCLKCYRYEPHAHLERLLKPPPKTSDKEFVFFPSSGDPAYATRKEWMEALNYARKYPSTTFLIQSKDPLLFLQFDEYPNNIVLGTTIETDLLFFHDNPSKYESYDQISKAPFPIHRAEACIMLEHKRKEVTIEPILDFSLTTLTKWIKAIEPEFVYVGYDNHNCHLPEPTLEETQLLIDRLKLFTEVRVKTLRKAWWEK